MNGRARARVCFPSRVVPPQSTDGAVSRECTHPDQVTSPAEVSGYLVGSPAFKAGGRGDPTTAGSIPVHLRHHPCGRDANSRVRRHILSSSARRRERPELCARPATFRVAIHPNWMNGDIGRRAGGGGGSVTT